MRVLIKLFLCLLCVGFCQAAHADNSSFKQESKFIDSQNIFFIPSYYNAIVNTFKGHQKEHPQEEQFDQFLKPLYFFRKTQKSPNKQSHVTNMVGFFLPDIASWNSQFIWIDIALEVKNSYLSDLDQIAVKIPFGIGYRKVFSSSRFMGVYAYSDSLWRTTPLRQLHAGVELDIETLIGFTMNGHYNFASNEEEKWSFSLHASVDYWRRSNFFLLRACTPYIGVAYTKLAKREHSTYITDTVWDGITGVRFNIINNLLSFSLESNVVDWKIRNVPFIISLCAQAQLGINANNGAPKALPKRYLSKYTLKRMEDRSNVSKKPNDTIQEETALKKNDIPKKEHVIIANFVRAAASGKLEAFGKLQALVNRKNRLMIEYHNEP